MAPPMATSVKNDVLLTHKTKPSDSYITSIVENCWLQKWHSYSFFYDKYERQIVKVNKPSSTIHKKVHNVQPVHTVVTCHQAHLDEENTYLDIAATVHYLIGWFPQHVPEY
jgi:hypothetical protein